MAFNILGCLVIISVQRVSRVYRVLTHALTSPPHPVYDCDSIRHLSIIGVSDPTLTSRQLLPLPPDADKEGGPNSLGNCGLCRRSSGRADINPFPFLPDTPSPLPLLSSVSSGCLFVSFSSSTAPLTLPRNSSAPSSISCLHCCYWLSPLKSWRVETTPIHPVAHPSCSFSIHEGCRLEREEYGKL